MSLTQITQPAAEPLTLALAKSHCKVETNVDDALISSYIAAARDLAEQIMDRAIINQNWRRTLDAFPDGAIELGKAQVRSIVRVTYVDLNGVTQELTSGDYSLDAITDDGIGWLLPSEALGAWPSTLDTANAVNIEFTSGYGADATAVPAAIISWIAVTTATLYKLREDVVVGTIATKLPERAVDRLLDRYIVRRV